VAVWFKVKLDKNTSTPDFIASRGITKTSLSKNENGLIRVKDVIDDKLVDVTLLARSYCDTIKKDSLVMVVQYDKDKKVYMVEPYV
jgi:hypothetical protein